MNAESDSSLFGKLRRLFIRALVFSAKPLPDERDAIWSIPRPLQIAYFSIFVSVCIPIIVDIVQEEIANHP